MRHRIRINRTWSFQFDGPLPAWKRAVLRWVIGWTVTPVKPRINTL
jgi:hypothetical protein